MICDCWLVLLCAGLLVGLLQRLFIFIICIGLLVLGMLIAAYYYLRLSDLG